MLEITRENVTDIYTFDNHREEQFKEYRQAQEVRTFYLGPHLILRIHTYRTVLFQLQDFLRSQRIADDDALRSVIKEYNTLLPEDGHLSGNLVLRIPKKENIQPRLNLLPALAQTGLKIQFNGEEIVTGTITPDRRSPVAFVEFQLTDDAIQAIANDTRSMAFATENPEYTHTVEVEPASRKALLADLNV
ncbi:MAG: DUF3501 family protein [Candidatus Marinimicrobia bacterium]|nr:DUF3501 family protein [Candidatus Neomarinimicrobiota bacterium]MCF7829841.1 DUF3501 family protein [Candidatus Neomarinimicrobiota bacterium]MCF7882469.1 DUF3501 family protein [Candidatus Neomarinimicrobiota bacterium]